MSAEISPVEAPSAVEDGSSGEPQFSANLFAGPCFGDLTPSESSLATLPDAPSPSPLLLTCIPDPESAPTLEPEIGDLIDFTSAEETASDLVLPSNDPSQNQVPGPSNAASLIDSNPQYHHDPSQPLDASCLPLMNVLDGRSDDISMLHFDDSSVLLCLDEQPLVPAPSTELSNPNPTADESSLPNLTNLPMLDESPATETTESLALPIYSMSDEPSNPTHPSILDENTMSDLANTEPRMLDESFTIEMLPTDRMPNGPPNVHFPQLPSSQLSVLDESSPVESTEPLTVPVSDENADSLVLPSSSPTDATAFSPFPLTPPTWPGSEPPLDAIESSTSFPLTLEHSSPRPLSTPHEVEPTDFATSLPPSSSPPNSSPIPIFSSSPPPASDSSVPPAGNFGAQKELESDTDMFADSTDLDSSPPQQSSLLLITEQMESDLALFFSEPPRSSSPLPPSSSPSDDLQFVETPEQGFSAAKSSDEILRALKLEHEEVLPQTAISDSSDVDVNFYSANDEEDHELPHSVILGKRKREEEEAKTAFQGEEIPEEMSTQPPNPKRPTLASQKVQRKMLAKPFRSPAMKPKAAEPAPPPPVVKKEVPPPEQLPGKAKDTDLKKHRTQRAAGQFKSPLPLALAASVPTAVRQTPTVQALERKVQVLRRAVKVRKDGEEETLEGLVRKWTEAGREVAWEVWGLVKDNQSGGGDDWGKESQKASSSSGKRRFEDSWGWNEESGSKRVKVEDGERNWGWDVSPAAAMASSQDQDHATVETVEDEEKPRDTLGTMLMRLGIAPSTLGWDDEEGEFVDE